MELNKNNLSATATSEAVNKSETIQVKIRSPALSSESAASKEVNEVAKLLEKIRLRVKNEESELETSKTEVDSKPSRTIKYTRPAPVAEWIMNAAYRELVKENMEKSTPTKVPIGLVFDLNGTLVKRAGTNNRTVYLRPHIHEFIEFVMKNFHIITWTTAKPHNSYKIICKAFGPYSDYILCNLTRLHCKVIGSYYHKSPTIKDLEVIWNAQFKVDSELATKTLPSPPTLPIFSEILNEETKLLDNPRVRDLYLGKDTNPQTLNNPKILQFNKTNTILLDDSPGKGEAQPLNHLVMPEYGGVDENNTDNSLLKLKQYLEEMIKEYKKTEAEGAQFSVQDYMKDKSFKDFLATENTTTSN